VNGPRQGEIWWAEAEDKPRPALVITRSDAQRRHEVCDALAALADC
jgi:mRNA-degrading endonuclease toxin of MazEF toxin-antitoxin module